MRSPFRVPQSHQNILHKVHEMFQQFSYAYHLPLFPQITYKMNNMAQQKQHKRQKTICRDKGKKKKNRRMLLPLVTLLRCTHEFLTTISYPSQTPALGSFRNSKTIFSASTTIVNKIHDYFCCLWMRERELNGIENVTAGTVGVC